MIKLVLFALIASSLSMAVMAQQYLGCCLDHSSTDLPFKIYSGNATSTNNCANWCADAGYLYAGAQNGNECWCGNQYCTVGSLDSSSCNKPCPSGTSASEKCGAFAINSVFKTPPRYIGCFVDSDTRDLPLRTNNTYDPIVCASLCYAGGYKYAANQNTDECWCGNSYGSQGAAPAYECEPCYSSNTALTCGIGWRNAVYRV